MTTAATHRQANPPPSTESTPSASHSVTGIAVDEEGDRASVTVELGEPIPLDDTNDETARACDLSVSRQRSTPQRSMAIPLLVSMTVLSSFSTDVSVNVNSFGFVMSGGGIDASGEQSVNGIPLWAGGYSAGPSCSSWLDVGDGAGLVHWGPDAAEPNVSQQWNAWLIVPNAITPNDPTGAEVAQRLVLLPTVTFAGPAEFRVDRARSHSLVECYSESNLIPGDVAVLAADSAVAVNAGCKLLKAPSGNSGDASKTSVAEICNSRYPSGQTHTVKVRGGTNTVYDRQASLEQVCLGFGAPEGLQLTPGMSCALIAAAATYGGPAVNAGTSKLCDTTAIASGYESDGWAGVSSSLASDKACGYFSDVFAGGVGAFAAGAASESGPGAVAVGVTTYKALDAFLEVGCGGLLAGGATSLGTKLEDDNETHIALDVVRHGKCILLSQKSGISGTSWHSTSCPRS